MFLCSTRTTNIPLSFAVKHHMAPVCESTQAGRDIVRAIPHGRVVTEQSQAAFE